ncbi:MAG TPA: uracil-DNA glycosylase [Syntrophomonadaceae bacterium]|nr:uracil-DNA glycosylase [Syntrophomonadaceae bacterium]
MTTYQPFIMPEDITPASNQSCQLCELHNHRTRVIWGEGNTSAPLFVVLDNPGAREDRNGKPFLCGTRETMQAAAYEAGITPDSLYISYILKCRPQKAYDKKTARATCIKFLWEQLQAIEPTVVVCLGDVVCQTFFNNPDVSVKELRGKVYSVRNYQVITSYHPLAIRRRPVLYKFFLQDWHLAASLLN